MKTWRVLDLFSGIGAFSLGLERAGMTTVAFCEIDAFCRQVLAKHWPDVPCHDDVTTREFTEGEADVICGGFPCQDVSAAGRRAGLAGTRSGLYRELVRAFRVVRPAILIVENVAALLSDGLGTVLGDLAESRHCRWIEWDCVPASAVGAPHQRDRVWVVAHARSAGTGVCEHRNCGQGRKPVKSHQPEVLRQGNGAACTERVEADDRNASDVAREQVGTAGQPRGHIRLGAGATDAARDGCGQGRPRRPPDSFARVRDEARRNAADPHGARVRFCGHSDRQSIWPDEPALQGVDDGDAMWMDRIRATGNQVLPQIPELIARAIVASLHA